MSWFLAHWTDVLAALRDHVLIAATALGIAFALSLPLGIAAARSPAVYRIAIGITGVLYTIPTLAFLALLIPLVGLGRTNAITCMVAFCLMILVRNIATAVREVPADVVDAARGMGLWRVELPLAAPVIVAGLRIAAVTVISVAVVAAFVDGGGLGTLIFAGISNDHAAKIWTGAIAACLLAVSVDLALGAVERTLRARAG